MIGEAVRRGVQAAAPPLRRRTPALGSYPPGDAVAVTPRGATRRLVVSLRWEWEREIGGIGSNEQHNHPPCEEAWAHGGTLHEWSTPCSAAYRLVGQPTQYVNRGHNATELLVLVYHNQAVDAELRYARRHPADEGISLNRD